MPQPRNLKDQLVNLLKKSHLLTVAEIIESLKKTGKAYNKTSVYRALENLLEEEIVCRHYFNQAQALYELRDHHHTHLVCNNCGNVSAEDCTYQQPAKLNGFKVEHHHLTLMGRCASCQK